ncbi:MAG: response regulator transcription factor [Gemmatimonadota bacterium]
MTKTLRVLLLAESGAETDFIRPLSTGDGDMKVRRVESSGAFIEALREFGPDVVLVDDTSAQLEAGSAIGIVQEERPTAPIIVIMSELNEARAAACLRAGAEAFVLRANIGKLGAVVEAAQSARQRLGNLTARQLDVLRRIAEGQKTREIARDLDLSVKTVETHRSEIKKRLMINELAGLVRYAARVGLVAIEAPPERPNLKANEPVNSH